MGPPGSGKSALLARVLRPSAAGAAAAPPPPPQPAASAALEYAFLRRAAGAGGGDDSGRAAAAVAHFWEMGGQEAAALALAEGDGFFLTFREVATAVVVVCLDLSAPEALLPAADVWLGAVRTKLAATFAVSARGPAAEDRED